MTQEREMTPRRILTLAKRLSSPSQRVELLRMLTTYVEEEEMAIMLENEQREQKMTRIKELLDTMGKEGISIEDMLQVSDRKETKIRRPRKTRKVAVEKSEPAPDKGVQENQ